MPSSRKPKTKPAAATLKVVRLPLASLLPHPRNAEVRHHPEPGTSEWEALRASLAHDYFDPIVWNRRNGMLVSGHLRTKVLEEMGVAEADVVEVDYDEHTHLARLLAANKGAGWDDPSGLRSLLADLEDVKGFDMALTGFALAEIPADAPVPIPAGQAVPPQGFQEFGEDIATEHVCPRCGYQWSGGKMAAPEDGDEGEDA